MTAAAFASLLGYMLVCSFTPGPGNILALNTTSTYGWKRSRLLILGICLGYAIVQAGCSIALYSLNQVFEPALKILRYVGGIYMIWLAMAGCFAVSIGSIACLTWAFLGVKLQKIYFQYFRPINAVLGLFLLYCAFAIVKG